MRHISHVQRKETGPPTVAYLPYAELRAELLRVERLEQITQSVRRKFVCRTTLADGSVHAVPIPACIKEHCIHDCTRQHPHTSNANQERSVVQWAKFARLSREIHSLLMSADHLANRSESRNTLLSGAVGTRWNLPKAG